MSALLIMLTVAAGLATRRFGAILPALVADYAPDALYALMVFWLAGFVRTRATTATVAVAALLFCYAIEASQLYQAPWIVAVRGTTPGALVLGHGFLWSDILCYTVGVGIGAFGELTFPAPIWARRFSSATPR